MMDGHRISLVAAGRQHDGGPEVAHRCEVRSPVAGSRARKDWTETGSNYAAGVRFIHQMVYYILRNVVKLFCPHRETTIETTTTPTIVQARELTETRTSSRLFAFFTPN